MRQSSANADRLAETDSASASNRNNRVGSLGRGILKSLVCDIRGSMHGRLAENTGDLTLEHILYSLGLANLLRCREHQRGLHLQAGDLIGELLQRAAAEDDTARVGIVLEGIHPVFESSESEACHLIVHTPHPTAVDERRAHPWGRGVLSAVVIWWFSGPLQVGGFRT